MKVGPKTIKTILALAFIGITVFFIYQNNALVVTNYRMQISFFHGEQEGDTIRLFYDDSFTNEGEIILTLQEQGNTYIFVSNKRVVP
jgi:hypothetical protein